MRRAHQRRRVRTCHGVPERLEMARVVREEDGEQLTPQLPVVSGVRERLNSSARSVRFGSIANMTTDLPSRRQRGKPPW